MGICEALGETGDFLKPFENYDEWLKFSIMYMKNPAIEKQLQLQPRKVTLEFL